ncbi:MAG: hypothetical protein QM804_17425 [Propionicimonas sp.]
MNDQPEAPPLSLDDPAWQALLCRSGSADWVPEWLRGLPGQPESFSQEWPELCSEDTTWPAGIAAFPHLVRIAGSLPAGSRLEYAAVLGLIVADWQPDAMPALPGAVEAAYRTALTPAIRIVADEAARPLSNERDVRYVLMALAALQGVPELASCIDDLDDEDTCPRYAAHVWGG